MNERLEVALAVPIPIWLRRLVVAANVGLAVWCAVLGLGFAAGVNAFAASFQILGDYFKASEAA